MSRKMPKRHYCTAVTIKLSFYFDNDALPLYLVTSEELSDALQVQIVIISTHVVTHMEGSNV